MTVCSLLFSIFFRQTTQAYAFLPYKTKKILTCPTPKMTKNGCTKIMVELYTIGKSKKWPTALTFCSIQKSVSGRGFYILDKDQILVNLKGEGNLIFYCIGSWENFFWVGWSVQKIIIIIIILSFRVGISKNIDHQVKETCAIVLTQVTYETDHISLICDSTVSSAANFCCLCILL